MKLHLSKHRRKRAVPAYTVPACLILLFGLCSSLVNAQTPDSRFGGAPTAEFHFARLMYSNAPGSRRGRRGGAWMTDYPDAEYYLMDGVNRMTRIEGELVDYYGHGGRLISLEDDQIFDFPWLYAAEVGQWSLSTKEAAQLREYLNRGGFLMVDDFWGEYEWQIFVQSMQRVFPDRPIVEIDEDDPVMHVVFDVDKSTQIPGMNGIRFGSEPQWRGIYDDKDRLIVAINFNMDMGDAWEHAGSPYYPAEMTAMAYRFAVNYIIYSMTH
ncbi:MAG TPA: hypothetical protein DCY55_12080 [Gammaproteobacteria bacterium]|jgi:hypothetical protein|nr:DUF4159 domain-containing protein [Pseudomonadota bacterium]HAY47002.1 hypothetical protein [Gammaproteobacteria bacterium]